MQKNDFPQFELSIKERYDIFLEDIKDGRSIWFIGDDNGVAMCQDDKNRSAIPVWPSSYFSDLFLNEGWEKYESRKI